MTTIGPESFYFGGEPFAVLLAALLFDAVVGGLPGLRETLALPETGLGKIVTWLDGRLNRSHRSAANRAMRGAAVVTITAAAAFAA